MFGIGMPELILIFVIALIIIGPKKLPDFAAQVFGNEGRQDQAPEGIQDAGNADGKPNGQAQPDGIHVFPFFQVQAHGLAHFWVQDKEQERPLPDF